MHDRAVVGIRAAYDLVHGSNRFDEVAKKYFISMDSDPLYEACLQVERGVFKRAELGSERVQQGFSFGLVTFMLIDAFERFAPTLRADPVEDVFDLDEFLEPLFEVLDPKGLGMLARMIFRGTKLAYTIGSENSFEASLLKKGFDVQEASNLCEAVLRSMDKPLWDLLLAEQQDVTVAYKAHSQPVKSVKKAIRGAAARSGVSCSPHVFRHTAGVWMAQSDVPMQKIAQFLGHTSTRVTERTYARYSPSFMRDAAAALDW